MTKRKTLDEYFAELPTVKLIIIFNGEKYVESKHAIVHDLFNAKYKDAPVGAVLEVHEWIDGLCVALDIEPPSIFVDVVEDRTNINLGVIISNVTTDGNVTGLKLGGQYGGEYD